MDGVVVQWNANKGRGIIVGDRFERFLALESEIYTCDPQRRGEVRLLENELVSFTPRANRNTEPGRFRVASRIQRENIPELTPEEKANPALDLSECELVQVCQVFHNVAFVRRLEFSGMLFVPGKTLFQLDGTLSVGEKIWAWIASPSAPFDESGKPNLWEAVAIEKMSEAPAEVESF